jgi:hypothetical protein
VIVNKSGSVIGQRVVMLPRVRRYTATAMLRFAQQDRAAAVLRANLRYQLAVGEVADWSTLVIDGPVEITDRRGRLWFEYQASVLASAGR